MKKAILACLVLVVSTGCTDTDKLSPNAYSNEGRYRVFINGRMVYDAPIMGPNATPAKRTNH